MAAKQAEQKPLNEVISGHFDRAEGQPLTVGGVVVEKRGHTATVQVSEPKRAEPEASEEAAA